MASSSGNLAIVNSLLKAEASVDLTKEARVFVLIKLTVDHYVSSLPSFRMAILL